MAVGVIIGSAFTAIVNSLVADIFTPLIGIIIGGIDFASLSFKIPDTEVDGKVITQGAELTYGNFIQNPLPSPSLPRRRLCSWRYATC